MTKDEIEKLKRNHLQTFYDSATERDFTEDFHRENGKYYNMCCVCNHYFMGYKRRVVCKVCTTKLEMEYEASYVGENNVG